MLVAHPGRHLAADEVVGRLVDGPRDDRAQQRAVDALATTRPRPAAIAVAPSKCGQDRHRPQHPCRQVGDGDADLGRPATLGIGHAGDGHQPGDRLDDEVEAGSVAIGPGRSIAGDRQAHQPGVDGLKSSVIEAQALQRARPEVLDEHIAGRQQPLQHLLARRRPDIQPDVALVPVHRQVVAGLTSADLPLASSDRRGLERRHEWRAVAPRRVAVRRLDLDHVRAKVTQQHRAVGSREDRGQVTHDEALERSGCGWSWSDTVPVDEATARHGRAAATRWPEADTMPACLPFTP